MVLLFPIAKRALGSMSGGKEGSRDRKAFAAHRAGLLWGS
jgi:hypothetical protein